MKLLVISTVWVEPRSSAAGSRMLQLLALFQEMSFAITYASTSGPSNHSTDLHSLGFQTASITLNDPSFDTFLKELKPDVVLFDRFMAEEQFGWRVADIRPNALRILDTEDLHCLRKAREVAVTQNRKLNAKDLQSDVALREIASIFRCDLALMISAYEMELLQTFFKVPAHLLLYIPFLLPELNGNFLRYEDRQHFVAIGNFLHKPNWDATLQLKNQVWPLIRKELPQAELHIYGAYSSEKVHQLHNEKQGFVIKGRAEGAAEVISQARVLLAPLRFGAGLKGKFIDAMQQGTPSVTTAIGAEAMTDGLDWGGAIEDENSAFAKAAIQLYTNKENWLVAQLNGTRIINKNFQKRHFSDDFKSKISFLLEHIDAHRTSNFTGQMLQHQSMRSTKFMSLWIEAKNT
ncbi:glycosyltransferase [Dokdonia sp. Hel_I_53]|uniref:glycosyltransferase n=1 Tax=Dokdonia sp. Hel_I_53 TaxID=1566287 RepID=UPI001199C8F0|nr:glycosyltransferase [Dokdonia sp. Hel_I_53]TVZ53162.1 glycosyltransferase involved in cell wall biosynthesis [Dokdonia sp. Hel_I_53]